MCDAQRIRDVSTNKKFKIDVRISSVKWRHTRDINV